jgi:hypothetical protein
MGAASDSEELALLIEDQRRDIAAGARVPRDYRVVSLDAPVGSAPAGATLQDRIAGGDSVQAYVPAARGQRTGASRGTSAGWKRRHPRQAQTYQRRENAKPERKAGKRAWARSSAGRSICADCGGEMGVGSGWKDFKRCRTCALRRQSECKQERRRAIADMWARGLSIRAIAAELDSTAGSIGVEIVRMRKDGWALPHRYRVRA